MKNFAQLFTTLESGITETAQVEALTAYLQQAPEADKLWSIALLMGKRPPRVLATKLLRSWAEEKANLPAWLFESTAKQVGDTIETISKIVPQPSKIQISRSLSAWIEDIIEHKAQAGDELKSVIYEDWERLSLDERVVYNKLLTGGFKLTLRQKTLTAALARYVDHDVSYVAYKLMSTWQPHQTSFDTLFFSEDDSYAHSKPYSFYLAKTMEDPVRDLGQPEEWTAEYKWDGQRCQVVKRSGQAYVWSRVGELITHFLPEFEALNNSLRDFVIDGDVVVFKDGVLPREALHKRITRKPTKKLVSESPALLIAYDIIELDGKDLRQLPLLERRQILEDLIKEMKLPVLSLSEVVAFEDWPELENIKEGARDKRATGLMIKSKQGTYREDRNLSQWYKWPVDPISIDAVMLYAHRGVSRSRIFKAFTFAVIDEILPSDGKRLVVITKATGDLPPDDLKKIAKFIKENTVERFGPVYSIKPELVFKISFLDIVFSSRNKAGLSLIGTQITSWLKDKSPSEIDTLQRIRGYIKK